MKHKISYYPRKEKSALPSKRKRPKKPPCGSVELCGNKDCPCPLGR